MRGGSHCRQWDRSTAWPPDNARDCKDDAGFVETRPVDGFRERIPSTDCSVRVARTRATRCSPICRAGVVKTHVRRSAAYHALWKHPRLAMGSVVIAPRPWLAVG